METVSNEAVAEYLPLIHHFAHKYNGVGGAEFDDLTQEGWLRVFINIKDEKPVTGQAIKNAMRDWCRKCRRQGIGHDDPSEG